MIVGFNDFQLLSSICYEKVWAKWVLTIFSEPLSSSQFEFSWYLWSLGEPTTLKEPSALRKADTLSSSWTNLLLDDPIQNLTSLCKTSKPDIFGMARIGWIEYNWNWNIYCDESWETLREIAAISRKSFPGFHSRPRFYDCYTSSCLRPLLNLSTYPSIYFIVELTRNQGTKDVWPAAVPRFS